MAVRVKLFATLVNLSKSKQPQFALEWRSGMTVQDVIDAEGFTARDAEALAAVVNAEHVQFDTELHDGDELELLINLQGGSGR